MAQTITIEGGDQLIAALQKLGRDGEAAISRVITATGLDVRNDIVKRIQRGPKTGRTYVRGKTTHQASAPGEAPATDTGRLASSVIFKAESKLLATVGSNVVYGAYLEFGTRFIAPRLAWRPAVEEIRPKYLKRLEDALEKVMK